MKEIKNNYEDRKKREELGEELGKTKNILIAKDTALAEASLQKEQAVNTVAGLEKDIKEIGQKLMSAQDENKQLSSRAKQAQLERQQAESKYKQMRDSLLPAQLPEAIREDIFIRALAGETSYGLLLAALYRCAMAVRAITYDEVEIVEFLSEASRRVCECYPERNAEVPKSALDIKEMLQQLYSSKFILRLPRVDHPTNPGWMAFPIGLPKINSVKSWAVLDVNDRCFKKASIE